MTKDDGLHATLGWSGDGLQPGPPDAVFIYFGETLIAELPVTASLSKAGAGDDSTYFDSEDRRIVEETIVPFLRGVFSTDKD